MDFLLIIRTEISVHFASRFFRNQVFNKFCWTRQGSYKFFVFSEILFVLTMRNVKLC